jgi:hypothetical protein
MRTTFKFCRPTAAKAAAEALMLLAERDGPTMMARIGIMRALNHGKPLPEIEPRRKKARVFTVIR